MPYPCAKSPLPAEAACALQLISQMCIAVQFRGKDTISKHGLRLFYVVRNPELVLAVIRYVMGNVIRKRRKLALKHIRRRCKQLQLQIPLGHCPMRMPWCLHEGNIPFTKSILKEFGLHLFWNDHFQAELFTHGRLKLRIGSRCLRSSSSFGQHIVSTDVWIPSLTAHVFVPGPRLLTFHASADTCVPANPRYHGQNT